MKKSLAVSFFAVILSACMSMSQGMPQEVIIPAKVYNIDNGSTFNVSFKWTGSGYGEAWGIFDNGVGCNGEYLTQIGGSSGSSVAVSQGWGSIYGWGMHGFSGARANASGVAVGSYASQPNTQIGSVKRTVSFQKIMVDHSSRTGTLSSPKTI